MRSAIAGSVSSGSANETREETPPAKRMLRVDVWRSGTRWYAGWSSMSISGDEQYVTELNARGPMDFWLVSDGETERAAILRADLPVPGVWRRHSDGADTTALMDNADRCLGLVRTRRSASQS